MDEYFAEFPPKGISKASLYKAIEESIYENFENQEAINLIRNINFLYEASAVF